MIRFARDFNAFQQFIKLRFQFGHLLQIENGSEQQGRRDISSRAQQVALLQITNGLESLVGAESSKTPSHTSEIHLDDIDREKDQLEPKSNEKSTDQQVERVKSDEAESLISDDSWTDSETPLNSSRDLPERSCDKRCDESFNSVIDGLSDANSPPIPSLPIDCPNEHISPSKKTNHSFKRENSNIRSPIDDSNVEKTRSTNADGVVALEERGKEYALGDLRYKPRVESRESKHRQGRGAQKPLGYLGRADGRPPWSPY